MQKIELNADGDVILIADNVTIGCKGLNGNVEKLSGTFECNSETAARLWAKGKGLSVKSINPKNSILTNYYDVTIYSESKIVSDYEKKIAELQLEIAELNTQKQELQIDIMNSHCKLIKRTLRFFKRCKR